jgi:hypothetical protein
MLDPKEVIVEFGVLCSEVCADFHLYRSLFEANQRDMDLLNSVAPKLFEDLNRILINNLFLQFSKITDPARTGKNANLTTNYLVEEIAWPDEVRQNLQDSNQRLKMFRKYIEKARSKRIAHADLPAQLEKMGTLGGFPEGTDTRFLEGLQAFINIAYGHFHQGSVYPIDPGTTSTDTHQLIRALEKAILYDRCSKCDENERNTAILDYESDEH